MMFHTAAGALEIQVGRWQVKKGKYLRAHTDFRLGTVWLECCDQVLSPCLIMAILPLHTLTFVELEFYSEVSDKMSYSQVIPASLQQESKGRKGKELPHFAF